jgi:predicted outer membrane repeat protein
MGSTARVARRWVAAPAVVALIGAGALAVGAGSVSAAGQVSPTTNADDGSPTSLRGILEGLSDATTTVVLPAGSGPYVLDDCVGGDIDIADTVVIEGNGNTVQQTCPDEGVLQTDTSLTIRNLTVTGGDIDDQGGGILMDTGPAALTIEGSTITGNHADDDGGGLMVADSDITVTITNSTISNNTAGDDGGGYDNEGGAGTLVVTASTFSGNTSGDLGGAIASEEDATPFTITNSTITKNTSGGGGAISNNEGDGDDIALQYDTITDNIVGVNAGAVANEAHGDAVTPQQGPEPASLSSTGAFSTFGTIITGPVNGPNCDLIDATSTSSNGYNFSDDATCALTNTARGDRENAGSPGLGALGDNGGPTFTQLPQTGSPVIDQIPTGSPCGGVDIVVDQRGITRPQGPACEEGSVEVLVAVALAPDFTG